MKEEFEIVFSMVADIEDPPMRGVANYLGKPHYFEYFEANWTDNAIYLTGSSFLLSPIDSETLNLAIEDETIWRRWLAARDKTITTKETIQCLPEDGYRKEELKRILADKLKINPERSIRAFGEFQHLKEDLGRPPIMIRWTPLA